MCFGSDCIICSDNIVCVYELVAGEGFEPTTFGL